MNLDGGLRGGALDGMLSGMSRRRIPLRKIEIHAYRNYRSNQILMESNMETSKHKLQRPTPYSADPNIISENLIRCILDETYKKATESPPTTQKLEKSDVVYLKSNKVKQIPRI